MNLKKPRFSIIIPLYNKEATIAATIDSALDQSYTDFELLIVNDGSTDNSLSIVRSYNNERIKVFTTTNSGVSAARNFAIKNVNGDYIAFLDADDLWAPQYLQQMNDFINNIPVCGMYASAFKKVTNKEVIINGAYLQAGVCDDFFKTRLQHSVPFTSATIISKAALDEVGGFPLGMLGGEDDYMWTKVATKFKVAFLPEVLVTYNFINNGIAFRKGKLDTCTESWFDFYSEGDFYRNEFIAQKAIHAAIRYAHGGYQNKSKEIEAKTAFTKLSKKRWRYLFIINRVPYSSFLFYQQLKAKGKTVKSLLKKLSNNRKEILKAPSYNLQKVHNTY